MPYSINNHPILKDVQYSAVYLKYSPIYYVLVHLLFIIIRIFDDTKQLLCTLFMVSDAFTSPIFKCFCCDIATCTYISKEWQSRNMLFSNGDIQIYYYVQALNILH